MAARALLAQGIGPGDRIFIMLPRAPAWYEAMLGAVRIGAVVMPGTNQLDRARTSPTGSRRAGAVAAITSDDGADKIDAITEELSIAAAADRARRRRADGVAGLGLDRRGGR